MGRRAWVLITILATSPGVAGGDEGEVRFAEQVAPILVGRCLACHGPKKAIAGFRVDTFARLMADSDAGRTIEPGKPEESLFLDLIVSNEPTGRMPKNADPLPAAEVDTLRRWIEQGARAGGVAPDADLAGLVARANRPQAPSAYKATVPIAALAFGRVGVSWPWAAITRSPSGTRRPAGSSAASPGLARLPGIGRAAFTPRSSAGPPAPGRGSGQ